MLHDMFSVGIPIGEKLLRSVVVYAFLLIGLRLAGKREMAQMNPFDFVVLLLLSNTVQNAIIGNDNSLLGGVIGATALLVTNFIVVRFLYNHPAADKIVEGEAKVLIHDGEIQHDELQHELITKEELDAAARGKGIDGLHKVQTCRLEAGGQLTFIEKKPSDEERRHDELLARLTSLTSGHEKLLERLSQLEKR